MNQSYMSNPNRSNTVPIGTEYIKLSLLALNIVLQDYLSDKPVPTKGERKQSKWEEGGEKERKESIKTTLERKEQTKTTSQLLVSTALS